MLQGLISCFQLLHQLVSLSKCCSREYSRCDGKVSSHNRPCPELLPVSESGPGGGVTMVTMPIHIWLPGPGIIAMVRSDNERTWDRILGQAGHPATLVRYNLSSQGWRGERERTLGFLSDLIATYIIGAGPGPSHIMTLDARYNMNFMHSGRIWPREKSWLRKGFARAARRRYLSYQFHWRISCSKSIQI